MKLKGIETAAMKERRVRGEREREREREMHNRAPKKCNLLWCTHMFSSAPPAASANIATNLMNATTANQ